MSRYEFHIHRDFGGIPAGDKEAVMDQLYHGPKTTTEMAANLSMDPIHARNVVSYLVSIGAVQQVGRGHNAAKVWGAKA